MPNERRRHQLYEELKEVLSVDSADELMEYFPPVGWADVATKADLATIRTEMDAQRAELRGEMSAMRSDLQGELSLLRADLRGELVDSGAEMRTQMAEMNGEISKMRHEMGGELVVAMADLKVDLQRWTITTLIAMTGLFGAIVFAAAKLGQ